MKRRNVKYGVFISVLAIIAFLSRKKSKSALKQFSKRIEDLTIMEEKNQASQDLHNSIGQTFTSVITSLDALPFLMKKSPEEAEKNINEMANLARKGLDEVRKTIHY
ncbi:histidine kinase dimerization/phosphoacceptor domain-containing protein [Neobacillus niacini]|uniref:histidine kinase dimerization/phosphoacceptor domain-containing protein n=1 Tax=Neobacillus niacini TaxID=86668 RepID=UPI0021CB6DBA|nr:histidine kinase dimerization/phosphoacceptor domain-containing protein [Neobacillus niacini]MCM3766055.1 histidine kinase dimerization/phosphoacceptor domain-containing protein [Neobacillus niacini]